MCEKLPVHGSNFDIDPKRRIRPANDRQDSGRVFVPLQLSAYPEAALWKSRKAEHNISPQLARRQCLAGGHVTLGSSVRRHPEIPLRPSTSRPPVDTIHKSRKSAFV